MNRACGKSPDLRLAREQLALLGPVQRQIQFGQTRRRELDGLPALQDHQDQLWAQEGKVNETPDVAPANGVTLGQILQRSGATFQLDFLLQVAGRRYAPTGWLGGSSRDRPDSFSRKVPGR